MVEEKDKRSTCSYLFGKGEDLPAVIVCLVNQEPGSRSYQHCPTPPLMAWNSDSLAGPHSDA